VSSMIYVWESVCRCVGVLYFAMGCMMGVWVRLDTEVIARCDGCSVGIVS
jgi:hypothetical protein